MASTDSGRTVLVTGANEGIGHCLAHALLDDGYRVAGLDVNTDGLAALADQHPDSALAIECDVTADEDVEAAVETVLDAWDRIDILVNNAAVFELGQFAERDAAASQREFAVNYFGYERLIRAVLPGMLERDDGIIHCVGSGVALTGHPGLSGYAASKGAIAALVKSLRHELRHTGVSCTLLYPPATRTRSAAELDYPDAATSDPADVGRQFAAKIESRKPVVYADWQTRIGLWVVRRFPSLVQRTTERFVERDPGAGGGPDR